MTTAGPLDAIHAYHRATKHAPNAFARSLGFLDWATQPDPFRRFLGAPLVPLEHPEPGSGPLFDQIVSGGAVPPAPFDFKSLSQLFYDALALSAWKQYQDSRWALRVNPSSGNLHPTEGYLVCGPLAGLGDRPGVYHYAPAEHALELRCELPPGLETLLAPGAIWVGFSSVYWREAWKYGERAFRYCQHDAGHAIAALAYAAAALGWEARLLEALPDRDLAVLLGIETQTGIEAEHPDCLLALAPRHPAGTRPSGSGFSLPSAFLEELRAARWLGTPNRLSPDHVEWPIIDAASQASTKLEPPPDLFWDTGAQPPVQIPFAERPLLARRILRQRRSAVDLDGKTRLAAAGFYRILARLLPGQLPFTTLPWPAAVHLGLFVHRVDGLEPGLYALVRSAAARQPLQDAMQRDFLWSVPEGCPEALPLFLLERGDRRRSAAAVSCGQDIAADGVFAVAMLARFEETLAVWGPWSYRRLHWEAGAIGQALYLEAEAAGIRGTGIGCFFDDATHWVFGLAGRQYQDLYHFTLGGPVEDARLQTHPAYSKGF